MQVLARVSFAAVVEGVALVVRAGEVVEMPAGADWLQAGLVTLIPTPVETAVEPQANVERATTRRKSARQ